MSLKHKSINIRVNQRILWFGSEAYPLHNITRTNTLTLTPKRGLAIRNYLRNLLLWLVAGAIAGSLTTGAGPALVVVAVLVVVVVMTLRLVAFLRITLYELVVETAAGSHRALLSDDGKVVTDLAHRITDAINNPNAEFQMSVENFQVGDNVTMFGGTGNVGKLVQ